jgi:hypothetical protein
MKDMRFPQLSLRAILPVLTWLLFGSACRKAEPPSAIVDRVREAGAGDVTAASEPGIEDWLRKHKDVAVQVNAMCAPARQNGNAEWGDTTEGKVCLAARNAAMSTYRSPRDGKSYRPNQ